MKEKLLLKLAREAFKSQSRKLIALNEIEGLALSTKVTNIEVQKDEKVAASSDSTNNF